MVSVGQKNNKHKGGIKMKKHIKAKEILKSLKENDYYDDLLELCNDEEINDYCQQYEVWQNDEALCDLEVHELAYTLYDDVMSEYHEDDSWSYDEF